MDAFRSKIELRSPHDPSLTLENGHCHVWILNWQKEMPGIGGNVPATPSEARFQSVRHWLLHLAASYLSTPTNTLQVALSRGGKPYFVNAKDLHFSISHTGLHAALAFCRLRPIGVDLENGTRNVNTESLANRYFHASENDHLLKMDKSRRDREFLRLWVLKEAAVKVFGQGLAKGLAGAVTRPLSECGEWTVGTGDHACRAWEFEVGELMGAVAVPWEEGAFRISIYAAHGLR